jgi:hypothetical protein
MSIVYKHKNKVTKEVFYIGIGKTESRAYSKHNRGKFWSDYVSKYEYEVEITHRNIIWEEACAIEKYLISFYGRRDLKLGTLVNQTDGGDGNNGIIQTKEANAKRSFALKGKKKKIGFNVGRKHSDETINKISNSHIGKKKPWVKWNKEQIKQSGLSRRVLTIDQYKNIIDLRNKGLSLSKISQNLQIHLGVVKKWYKKQW